jgi:hypothetical protein
VGLYYILAEKSAWAENRQRLARTQSCVLVVSYAVPVPGFILEGYGGILGLRTLFCPRRGFQFPNRKPPASRALSAAALGAHVIKPAVQVSVSSDTESVSFLPLDTAATKNSELRRAPAAV